MAAAGLCLAAVVGAQEQPEPTGDPSAIPAAATTGDAPRPPMHEYAVAWVAAIRPAPAEQVVEPPNGAPAIDVASAAPMVAVPADPVPALSYDASGLPRITGFQTNAPTPIVDLVEKLAPVYQLSPELVLAFMQAESGFNPNAQSPRNAKGLMQLIPGTAERFNVRNPFDPKQNIRGGMAYLRWLLAYFEGDLTLVAAGYNAGERRVDRYLGVPPYGETRAYVKRVVEALGVDSHPYDASITEPSARLEQIRASRARN